MKNALRAAVPAALLALVLTGCALPSAPPTVPVPTDDVTTEAPAPVEPQDTEGTEIEGDTETPEPTEPAVITPAWQSMGRATCVPSTAGDAGRGAQPESDMPINAAATWTALSVETPMGFMLDGAAGSVPLRLDQTGVPASLEGAVALDGAGFDAAGQTITEVQITGGLMPGTIDGEGGILTWLDESAACRGSRLINAWARATFDDGTATEWQAVQIVTERL